MASQPPRSKFENNQDSNLNSATSIDCVELILKASNLERAGKIEEAIAVYKKIIKADAEGTYRKSAEKAIEALQSSGVTVENTQIKKHTAIAPGTTPPQKKAKKWLDLAYDLPIRNKQLIALSFSQIFAIIFLFLASAIIVNNGRSQLKQQAESELEVAKINYQIKIDQMGFGFRGQSDNAAVIQAARLYDRGEQIPVNLRQQVKDILDNEIEARTIEYATLIGKDKKIIVSANADRSGENFDPQGLVSQVLQEGKQIKSSEIVAAEEIARESPPLPPGFSTRETGLIRYTVTPVREPQTNEIIGVLVSGDIVNKKQPIVANTVAAFDDGYTAIYAYENQIFSLVTAFDKNNNEITSEEQLKASQRLLKQAIENDGETVWRRINLEGKKCWGILLPLAPQCYTMSARAINNNSGQPVAVIVRGTDEKNLNAIISGSIWGLLLLAIVALSALNILFTKLLGKIITKRIANLKQVTQAFSQGDRNARAEVLGTDEIGQLTTTFNQMADTIAATELAFAKQTQQQKKETATQRQEKERLQEEVIKLLLEIEGARDGDLTVKGKVTDGVVGSIADAINTTIRQIRQSLLQVKATAEQVNQQSQIGEDSVQELSKAAFVQAMEINEALESVAQMNDSIQNVANSAAEAAEIARMALSEAQEGDIIMEQTVDNIETIRATVAGNAKKVKQLAESSQEISQIVEIISNISEKTNLLAFNASIEAARAGEHGEGFRTVADEVRRLADRVTQSTKDIQQLVGTIQRETGIVVQSMESSTTEVILGTELVRQTQKNLKNIAATSGKIDEYLQSISSDTAEQTDASQKVNEKISEIAAIAENTSSEAETVLESLHTLVEGAKSLESSISKFHLES